MIKQIFVAFSLFIAILVNVAVASLLAEEPFATMNAVVGNAGVEWKFGCESPLPGDRELVSAHLEFALNRLTTTKNNSDARNRSLAWLSEYIQAGVFPYHEDYSAPHDRMPCFIDSQGVPCAVAHLMQKSDHSGLANKIATSYKHSTIEDMATSDLKKELIEWQEQSGLTVQELAVIQPTYEFVQAKKARLQFAAIMEKMDQVAAPIRKGDTNDISGEVAVDLQDEIRKFAVSFRNGNIDERAGGARSNEDVKPGRFGWTERDMNEFSKRIDNFAATLPADGCEKLRVLIQKLSYAATGKRNKEDSGVWRVRPSAGNEL